MSDKKQIFCVSISNNSIIGDLNIFSLLKISFWSHLLDFYVLQLINHFSSTSTIYINLLVYVHSHRPIHFNDILIKFSLCHCTQVYFYFFFLENLIITEW